MVTQLKRVAFKTDRALEFFTESELTTQLGYGPKRWPLVLVKELIDNALDACESTTLAPKITVTIEDDAITVTDNGPGIAANIIEKSLDYQIRISDKKGYISPTRGQLGNALKCVWSAPFVVHGQGLIEVRAGGRYHRIEVSLDRLAQRPLINHTVKAGSVRNGTSVKIHWPQVASYPADDEEQEFYRAETIELALTELIADFAAFNPHASFALCVQSRRVAYYPATDPNWRKWREDALTSPHWCTPTTLRVLIAAYITEGEGERHLRDFVGEFSGLSGTQVRAEVLGPFTKAGVRTLSDLVAKGDVDLDLNKVTSLLDAMKRHSKPVEPARLGVLGHAHLEKVLTACGAGAVKYRRIAEFDEQGLPFVVEAAFGIKGSDREEDQEEDTADRRRLIIGMNWSPVFKIPASSIDDTLGNECLVGHRDSVVYLLHMAHPRFMFTDHGKGALADE